MKQTRILLPLLLSILAAHACNNPTPPPQENTVPPSTSVSSSSTPSTDPPQPSAVPEPPPPKDPSKAKQWSGAYESTHAAMETPNKVPDFTWKKDDKSIAMGSGRISLTIMENTLSGTTSGPLGTQHLIGTTDESVETPILRIELLPTDPTAPDAMQGTGTAELKDGKFQGTIRVAGPKGIEVREVTFSLEPS